MALLALWRGVISHSRPPQCRPFLDLIKIQLLFIIKATHFTARCACKKNKPNLQRDEMFSSGSVLVPVPSVRVCVESKRETRCPKWILKQPPSSSSSTSKTSEDCLYPLTLASLLHLLSYGWSSNVKKRSRRAVSRESLRTKMLDYGSFEETQ